MKKYRFAYIFVVVLCFFTLPLLINAADFGDKIQNPIKSKTFAEFIDKILQVVINIGYVVVVFFIVYTGFLFVSARGNEEQLKTAKSAFLWTVIGSAIILGAQVLEKGIAKTVTDLQN